MSHLKEALLLICLFTGYVYGLDCSLEILERNIFDHWFTTCPRLFDPKENNYCCVDVENKRSYCCTLLEFAKTTGVILILPVAAAVIGIIFLVVGCISCFCCGCCPWYRRPQGIQTPVQVIQSPANVPPSYTSQPTQNIPTNYTSQPTQNIPPSYTSQPTQNIPTNYTSQPTQNYVPPHPMDLTAMPQPPPYTDEAYAKQAPYNPAYLSSHLQ